MSPAYVFEPTYRRLKGMLLEGQWPRGARLDALRLADEFGVSTTPVRDCLNRLVGERLVEFEVSFGYHVPGMTERRLRELFCANLALLGVALASTEPRVSIAEADLPAEDYAERTSAVFARIAAISGNSVLLDAMLALNDQLHPVRHREPACLDGAIAEIARIELLVGSGGPQLANALHVYHARRLRAVPGLVELLA